MQRPHFLAIGAIAYALSIAPMVYLAGFLAGFGVSKSVDSGVAGPAAWSLAVDLTLLLFFAVTHSALARPGVKALAARFVPAELERSTYSLIAGLQMTLLLLLWRPLPLPVWRIEGTLAAGLLWVLFLLGWAVVLWALSAVSSTRLFGLRQAWAAARGREYVGPQLAAEGPYRLVRHPLYTGTIVALFATPTMSQGHLLLAVVFSAYILVGMRYEERDLEGRYGASWTTYRAAVPALWPRLRFPRPLE